LFGLNLYLHNSLSSDLKPQKSPRIDPFLVVIIKNNSQGGNKLARSNYQFNKRQKELTRKKKKDEKRQRKLDKNPIKSEENPNQNQSPNEEENLNQSQNEGVNL
jgi:hypothetical protein